MAGTDKDNNKTPCVIPNQGASVPKPVIPSPELKQTDTKLTNDCNGK